MTNEAETSTGKFYKWYQTPLNLADFQMCQCNTNQQDTFGFVRNPFKTNFIDN